MALSAQLDGEHLGRYRLLEQIGAGGMAVVFRAVAEGSVGKQVVVIKRVLPELARDPVFIKMLVAEARLSSRLSHPGIVRMHELGRVGDEYFLAMEHVDGADLVRVLNRSVAAKATLPIPVVCHIARQVALALAYAHDLKDAEGRPLEIVHRDVSPSNIMVTGDGGVKLLDFGVAKAAAHIRDERTRTGTIKGKINYLSPEQADGLAADRRSDVFALGIVLYECLTLKRLFRGDNDLATLRLVRRCEVPPPSQLRAGVPPALDAIVRRMLAREPSERFANCHEVAAALEPLAGERALLQGFLGALGPQWCASSGKGRVPMLEMDGEPLTGPTEIVLVAAEPSSPQLTAPTPRRRLWRRAAQVAILIVAAVGGMAAIRAHRRPAAPVAAALTPMTAPPVSRNPLAQARAASPSAAASRPNLVITVDAPAANIVLDGTLVAAAVHKVRIPIDLPGEHQLLVTAPRRKPFSGNVTVPPRGDVDFKVKLGHVSPPVVSAKQQRLRGENYLVDPFGPRR